MVDEYSRDYRLYFAYGADMLDEHIKTRCFAPEFVTVAKLKGYRLAFFGHTYIWDGAQETLVKDADSEVWGIVYKMSAYEGLELDSYQDVRLDGAGQYFHYPLVVEGTDGQTYYPLMYKKNMTGAQTLPSEPFMDVVIAGAIDRGLPEDYIEKLRDYKTKQAGYEVPLATMPRRVECGGCDDLLKKIG